MSSQMLEVLDEPEDDRPASERELEAYHAAVQHLDPEDVLHAACARLPYEGTALAELLRLEFKAPVEDIDRCTIHPDLAQQVALQCLRALKVSIDEQAGVHHAVEAHR